MFHFLGYKNRLLFNNNIQLQVVGIQSLLLNPFRKCHHGPNPPTSFLFQYLQTSLGFSPERALALSQRLKNRKPRNPDSVLSFFKSHGFSETHIKSIIDRSPELLSCASPESTLLPKVQFLKERGISESDLADLMVSNPSFFTRSLEGHIKPALHVLASALGTDEFAVRLLIRSKHIFNLDRLSTNQTMLRNCGVQSHHLSKLFMNQPWGLEVNSHRLIEVVEMVKGMGFKPQSYSFVQALFTIVGLSRRTWNAKFKLYMSLGWSAEEILSLFRRHPPCMLLSEEKIRKGFDYLTKELGWDPSLISRYPTFLSHSLEKRIIPRHRFLQFLASKGFIKNDKVSPTRLLVSEEKFLKNFVAKYESKVPDILKIYDGMTGEKLLNIKGGEGHVQ
ncbi:hypothetical protein ACLOJK_025007 [Asimina triloba]